MLRSSLRSVGILSNVPVVGRAASSAPSSPCSAATRSNLAAAAAAHRSLARSPTTTATTLALALGRRSYANSTVRSTSQPIPPPGAPPLANSSTTSQPLPDIPPSSPLASAVPPKRRSLFRRALRFTLLLNLVGAGVLILGGLAGWVYWSWVVPAKTVYKRGRDGLTYAVGVYDTSRAWYSWTRGWYGYLFLGERGAEADNSASDEVVGVKGK